MRRFLRACVFLALTLPSPAQAQQPNIQEADKRFQEGIDLFKAKKFAEAHVKFVEACAAHRTPQCPMNLALAEIRLDRHADAATHLREYLRSPEGAKDPDSEGLRQVYIAELSKVGELRVDARDGALVKVDDKPVGKAPLGETVFVESGPHRVVATFDNDVQSRDASVAAKQVVDVDAKPATDGSVLPPPGGHGVKPPPAPAVSPARWIVPTVLGVSAAVLLGLGAGFGVSSSNHGADADAIRAAHPATYCTSNPSSTDCTALADATSSQDSARGASIGFWIAGGVLAAAAVVTIVLWPRSSTTAVLVSPTRASLRVSF